MLKWLLAICLGLLLLSGCGGSVSTSPGGGDGAEQPANGEAPDDDKFPIDDETDIASAFLRSLA